MYKRINHEINTNIIPSNEVSDVQLHILYKPERVDVVMVELQSSDILFFILDKGYPFRPPGVTVSKTNNINDGIDYISYFTKLNGHIINYMRNKLKVRCLCCDTILCNNLWRPTFNMILIINEFIKRKNTVKEWYIIESLKTITDKFKVYDNYLIDHIFQFYST
jgi:hypothetical protein